jgi:hypothetical protein
VSNHNWRPADTAPLGEVSVVCRVTEAGNTGPMTMYRRLEGVWHHWPDGTPVPPEYPPTHWIDVGEPAETET